MSQKEEDAIKTRKRTRYKTSHRPGMISQNCSLLILCLREEISNSSFPPFYNGKLQSSTKIEAIV
jgi:hypothetical protein